MSSIKFILYLKQPGNKGSDAVRAMLRQIPAEYTRRIQEVSYEDTLSEFGARTPSYLQSGAPVLATYENPPTVYRGSDVIKHIRAWAQGAPSGHGGPPHHRMTAAGPRPPPPPAGRDSPELEEAIPTAAAHVTDQSPAMFGVAATDDLYQTRIVQKSEPSNTGRRRRGEMEEQIKAFNEATRTGRGAVEGGGRAPRGGHFR